jgi:hypothetical protein
MAHEQDFLRCRRGFINGAADHRGARRSSPSGVYAGGT